MNAYLFPHCASNPVTTALEKARDSGDTAHYFAAFSHLLEHARREGVTAQSLREYCVHLLLDAACAGDYFCDPQLTAYLDADLAELYALYFAFDWAAWCADRSLLLPPGGGAQLPAASQEGMAELVGSTSPTQLRLALTQFFAQYADRAEAVYAAFRWDGAQLLPIPQVDGITFDHLAGLAYQKQQICRNTEAFLQGHAANHVLLVGGSGTGKSSCVKATLNQYAGQGLRLVELSSQDMGSLPLLMRLLRDKKQRYIVFIDDLSFDGVDTQYMDLKVALDGQLEARPANVLLYATSNRRHLVRESWRDRQAGEDIHQNDTQHEKMSLSERFGIHLYFAPLSQPEYFDAVALHLSREGIPFSPEIAQSAATWATANSGRNGRSAKQFSVQYLALSPEI